VGFEKIVELGDTAAFVSVGGYHHHLAFNTWRGRGVPAAPADAVGLRHWTIYVPSEADMAAVRERVQRAGVTYESREAALLLRDPSGNAVLVAAAPAPEEALPMAEVATDASASDTADDSTAGIDGDATTSA
jgi:catechol 2,3-dioxygenase